MAIVVEHNNVKFKIPIEPDNSVLIKTVKNLFPQSTGLYYVDEEGFKVLLKMSAFRIHLPESTKFMDFKYSPTFPVTEEKKSKKDKQPLEEELEDLRVNAQKYSRENVMLSELLSELNPLRKRLEELSSKIYKTVSYHDEKLRSRKRMKHIYQCLYSAETSADFFYALRCAKDLPGYFLPVESDDSSS